MPSFNKGVFEEIQFEAIPTGRFRILSSTFRWYRPYAPGDIINFKLKLKSLSKDGSGFRLLVREGGKKTSIGLFFAEEKVTEIKINGISVPGEGSIDYFFEPVFNTDKSIVVVSVIATHNDWWISFIFGSFITLTCTILSWLLSGLMD